jgi:hypothetical protein
MTLTSICLNRPQANQDKKEQAVINDVEIVTAPEVDQNQIKADAYLDASRRAHGSYMAAKARYYLNWTELIAFSRSLRQALLCPSSTNTRQRGPECFGSFIMRLVRIAFKAVSLLFSLHGDEVILEPSTDRKSQRTRSSCVSVVVAVEVSNV